MVSIAEMWRGGGIWMPVIAMLVVFGYLMCLGGGTLVLISLFKRISAKVHVGVGVALVLMTFLILAVGFLGQWMGLAEMEAALAHAAPEQRLEMAAMGREWASYPWTFAKIGCALPGLMSFVVLCRAFLVKAAAREET